MITIVPESFVPVKGEKRGEDGHGPVNLEKAVQ
jgi:hypothetical protein